MSPAGTTATSAAVARLGALAFLALGSCGRDAPVDGAAIRQAPMPPTPSFAGETAHPVPLPAASSARAAAAVGGCKDDCADPRTAVSRFLEATTRTDGADAATRFLDSTRLVLDGRALGARWIVLWRDLKSATRKDEIGEVIRDLAKWTTGLSPAQVRDALTAGPKVVRIWSTEAEFEFQPPGAPTWTLVLTPRGVEWLITEVRRGREETP